MDRETKEILTAAQHLEGMVAGEGWAIARARLVERIVDLQNINNVSVESPEAMMIDLKARKMAADLLFAWMRSDVEGAAEQARLAKDPARPDDGFIERA